MADRPKRKTIVTNYASGLEDNDDDEVMYEEEEEEDDDDDDDDDDEGDDGGRSGQKSTKKKTAPKKATKKSKKTGPEQQQAPTVLSLPDSVAGFYELFSLNAVYTSSFEITHGVNALVAFIHGKVNEIQTCITKGIPRSLVILAGSDEVRKNVLAIDAIFTALSVIALHSVEGKASCIAENTVKALEKLHGSMVDLKNSATAPVKNRIISFLKFLDTAEIDEAGMEGYRKSLLPPPPSQPILLPQASTLPALAPSIGRSSHSSTSSNSSGNLQQFDRLPHSAHVPDLSSPSLPSDQVFVRMHYDQLVMDHDNANKTCRESAAVCSSVATKLLSTIEEMMDQASVDALNRIQVITDRIHRKNLDFVSLTWNTLNSFVSQYGTGVAGEDSLQVSRQRAAKIVASSSSSSSGVAFPVPIITIPDHVDVINPTCFLANRNLSCFMDSIIFVFMAIPCFVDLLLKGRKSYSSTDAPLIHFLGDLILRLHANPQGSNTSLLDNDAFKKACKQEREEPHVDPITKVAEAVAPRNSEMFFNGGMHDAQEFYGFLFDKIIEEQEAASSSSLTTFDPSIKLMSNLIDGKILRKSSLIGCLTDHNTSYLENIRGLQRIDLPETDAVLNDLVKAVLSCPEEMNGNNRLHCTFCDPDNVDPKDKDPKNQVMRCGTKTTQLQKAPDVLALWLSRYLQGSRAKTSASQEIEPIKKLISITFEMSITLEVYPVDGVPGSAPELANYDLVGTVNSTIETSLLFGHFWGFFKFDGKWYRVDDRNMKHPKVEVSEEDVMNEKQSVYLLYYVRL